MVDSEFLYYLAGEHKVKKETMSDWGKKKRKKEEDNQEEDSKSSTDKRATRLKEGQKRLEKVKEELKNHDNKVLEKLNADRVKYMQSIVSEMAVPMHSEEFEAKLVHLEELIQLVAISIEPRGKRVGNGDETGETEVEEGEDEREYQRQQRALFQELHSY